MIAYNWKERRKMVEKRKRELDGEKDEWLPNTPHANLLSQAICTLPQRDITHGHTCHVTTHGSVA